MRYGKIEYDSVVDGDGFRVSLFVSGCRNHCPGCFNRETWDFSYGDEFTPVEENEVIEACKRSHVSGLTVLGGEPFEPENQTALLDFLARFKKECPDRTLWMFTGYVLDRDLLEGQRKHVDGVTYPILRLVDVLVDGPFIQEQRDVTLRFRGSANQRILTTDQILSSLSR